MSFDPKLKIAMSEVEAVLRKHDIGGFFSLNSKLGGEFRFMLPSWGLLFEEETPKGPAVRLRIKVKEHTKEQVELTAAYIFSGRDISATFFQFFDRFAREIQAHAEVEHKPFHEFEPHNPSKQSVQ